MLTIENLTKAVLQDYLVWAWRMTGQLNLRRKRIGTLENYLHVTKQCLREIQNNLGNRCHTYVL